jgi:hypothetical protein
VKQRGAEPESFSYGQLKRTGAVAQSFRYQLVLEDALAEAEAAGEAEESAAAEVSDVEVR